MTVHAAASVDRALWGITLWTPDLLLSPIVMVTDRKQVLSIPGGESILECSVATVALAPGQYAFRCAIIEAETMDILLMDGYESEPTYFEVQGTDEFPVETPIGGSPLMVLQVEWVTEGKRSEG